MLIAGHLVAVWEAPACCVRRTGLGRKSKLAAAKKTRHAPEGQECGFERGGLQEAGLQLKPGSCVKPLLTCLHPVAENKVF